MYEIIQNGEVIGISETLVHIYLGANGCYQQCDIDEAQGFVAKLPKTIEIEKEGKKKEIEVILDTVFVYPDKKMKGDEPEALYRQIIE